MQKYKVLRGSLSTTRMKRAHKQYGEVTGIVLVDLSEIIGKNLGQYLDMLSTKLTGTDALENVHYTLVGHTSEGKLHIQVWGDPSTILDL